MWVSCKTHIAPNTDTLIMSDICILWPLYGHSMRKMHVAAQSPYCQWDQLRPLKNQKSIRAFAIRNQSLHFIDPMDFIWKHSFALDSYHSFNLCLKTPETPFNKSWIKAGWFELNLLKVWLKVVTRPGSIIPTYLMVLLPDAIAWCLYRCSYCQWSTHFSPCLACIILYIWHRPSYFSVVYH